MKRSKKLLLLGLVAVFGVLGFNLYNLEFHGKWTVLGQNDFHQYNNKDPNAVVIYPIFTQYAYSPHGFYDYYKGKCDSCLTVSMNQTYKKQTFIVTDIGTSYTIMPSMTTGESGFAVLHTLNYSFLTDIDVDKNPSILDNYSKVILLHNEYMTQKESDAISKHNPVLYLYPNSMYAKISVDYDKNTITLVKGHGYPSKDILNGLGTNENSDHEYDYSCNDYKWEVKNNGKEITCYPELILLTDKHLLETIRDFPN